jgi:hypothetical protein
MVDGQSLGSKRYYENAGPLDSKTYFENLTDACGPETIDKTRILGKLEPHLRVKGLKFVVRDNKGDGTGEPVEYWFTEDYSAGTWTPSGVTGRKIPQPVLYKAEAERGAGDTLNASDKDDFPYKPFTVPNEVEAPAVIEVAA